MSGESGYSRVAEESLQVSTGSWSVQRPPLEAPHPLRQQNRAGDLAEEPPRALRSIEEKPDRVPGKGDLAPSVDLPREFCNRKLCFPTAEDLRIRLQDDHEIRGGEESPQQLDQTPSDGKVISPWIDRDVQPTAFHHYQPASRPGRDDPQPRPEEEVEPVVGEEHQGEE